MGFTLTWTSKEACAADSTKKFTFKINAYCAKKKDGASDPALKEVTKYSADMYKTWVAGPDADTSCSAEYSYYGDEACKLYTFELGEALEFVQKFMGLFLLIGGLAFLFFGTKLLIWGFYGLVFILASAVTFFGIYNLALPTSTSKYILAGVLVVCLIIGGFAAYCTGKMFDKYGVALISTVGGIVVGLEICQLFSTNSLYVSVAALVGGAVGFYLGKKLDLLAKSVTTSLIGAFLLLSGVKCYSTVLSSNPTYELGALVALTLVGSFVQFRYLKRSKDENDDDFMAAEDESKICGCC
jgi:hypothetical protein